MNFQVIPRFVDPDVCVRLLATVQKHRDPTRAQGVEEGSHYVSGLAREDDVLAVVKSRQAIDIAKSWLRSSSLGFLSLTALEVESGSKGMPTHVDYPHFHANCDLEPLLCAQFVLALDGTTGGAAPTFLYEPCKDEPTVVELAPGDLLTFPGNTRHGVKPNTSARTRTNLLWSVGPVWVKPMQQGLWGMTIDDVPVREILTREKGT